MIAPYGNLGQRGTRTDLSFLSHVSLRGNNIRNRHHLTERVERHTETLDMPPAIDPALKDKPANPPVVIPSGGGNNIIVRPVQVSQQTHGKVAFIIRDPAREATLFLKLSSTSARNMGILWQTSKSVEQQVSYFSGMDSIYRCNQQLIITVSLKYHRLHPEYVHTRIEKLGHSYTLRILLILCDVVSTHFDHRCIVTQDCLVGTSRPYTRAHEGELPVESTMPQC